MKHLITAALVLFSVLTLTSCAPLEDWTTHNLNISVYNWTGENISLRVFCSDSGKTTHGAELTDIADRTDEAAEPVTCVASWIPGKYYKDIDGFVSNIDFTADVKKGGQLVSFANWNGKPVISLEIDRNHDVEIGVIKSFMPPSMTYEQWVALHDALSDEGGTDSDAYALSEIYRHYVFDPDAEIPTTIYFNMTDIKDYFEKVNTAVAALITAGNMPSGLSIDTADTHYYFFKKRN